MQAAILVGWLGREWVRSPAAWLALLAAGLIGPATLLLSPLGVEGAGSPYGSYMGSLWFLSTYFGAMTGLAVLSRGGTLWSELALGSQVSLGGLAILSACLLYGAAAVVALRVFEPTAELSGASFFLCAGHWAALATCIQRSGWSLAAKLIALTCLGWWIPALLDGAAGWERLRWVLAPQRHLAVGGQSIETSLGVLVDTIPLVAWWVAAALLPTRSAFKR